MTQSKVKGLIVKYFIEFIVIVFSISISFFVENLREEREKEAKRVLIVNSLINEIESNETYLNDVKGFYIKSAKVVDVYIKDSLDVGILKAFDNRMFSPANTFFTALPFEPSNSIYNSLVNDGSLNLIKSPYLKSKIDEFYKYSRVNITRMIEGETDAAKQADKMFIHKYPKLYLRNFWNNYNDEKLLQDFVKVINSDDRFKALMMQKYSFMQAKVRDITTYLRRRDTLIVALKKSL